MTIAGTQQKEKNRQRSSLMQLGVWPLEGVCHAPHSHRSCNEELLMWAAARPRASIDALPNGVACVCLCGCTPVNANGHKRTKNSSESCQSVALFNFFLILRFVCTSSVLRTSYFVLRSLCFFLARDAYTEPIQTRSGLIEARYLCRPSCAARIESRAEIGELGGSDCFNRPTHARNPDALKERKRKQNQCYPQWIGTGI